MLIKFSNVAKWLKDGTYCKKMVEMYVDEDLEIECPDRCYIHQTSDLKLSDLIKVYESSVWWGVNLPQDFYEYCINNKYAVLEEFKKSFLINFNKRYIPL